MVDIILEIRGFRAFCFQKGREDLLWIERIL